MVNTLKPTNFDNKMASGNDLYDMKQTILELISELSGSIFTKSSEQGDLFLVQFFFKQLHPEMVMQHVIKKVLPHKNMIKDRDIKFFLKNKSIFAGLPDDRVSYYGNIIVNTDRLDDEDKKEIWAYFDTLIELAESHKKYK